MSRSYLPSDLIGVILGKLPVSERVKQAWFSRAMFQKFKKLHRFIRDYLFLSHKGIVTRENGRKFEVCSGYLGLGEATICYVMGNAIRIGLCVDFGKIGIFSTELIPVSIYSGSAYLFRALVKNWDSALQTYTGHVPRYMCELLVNPSYIDDCTLCLPYCLLKYPDLARDYADTMDVRQRSENVYSFGSSGYVNCLNLALKTYDLKWLFDHRFINVNAIVVMDVMPNLIKKLTELFAPVPNTFYNLTRDLYLAHRLIDLGEWMCYWEHNLEELKKLTPDDIDVILVHCFTPELERWFDNLIRKTNKT